MAFFDEWNWDAAYDYLANEVEDFWTTPPPLLPFKTGIDVVQDVGSMVDADFDLGSIASDYAKSAGMGLGLIAGIGLAGFIAYKAILK